VAGTPRNQLGIIDGKARGVMADVNDPVYLKNQYHDTSNLVSRIDLHSRFSVNHYGWVYWVFDHLPLKPSSKVLELGCGTGGLWEKNLERIPGKCRILLTDFSAGMLEHVRQNLSVNPVFKFKQVDATVSSLPFRDASFDTVIANHMLYHIPDRQNLFSEIRRILKPEGYLCATTVGERHLIEIKNLVKDFNPEVAEKDDPAASFTLENGALQLASSFKDISLDLYEDSLEVTETAPLVDYILSGFFHIKVVQLEEFRKFIHDKIEHEGGNFHITKESGIFLAKKK
jgi:ubiquinone/menaquinone biosynthesis C-methylase UbiE